MTGFTILPARSPAVRTVGSFAMGRGITCWAARRTASPYLFCLLPLGLPSPGPFKQLEAPIKSWHISNAFNLPMVLVKSCPYHISRKGAFSNSKGGCFEICFSPSEVSSLQLLDEDELTWSAAEVDRGRAGGDRRECGDRMLGRELTIFKLSEAKEVIISLA